MWLIVGLGNPGPKYAGNRHNIGFMVIDEIAARCRAGSWQKKFGGEISQADVSHEKAVLLKPMEFMNLSGGAVQRAATFHKVEAAGILVVYDEIDLPLGRLRIKVGGGHGGHNGLRSIIQQLGSPEFIRIRCGVGRPGAGGGPEVADFVLHDFAKSEQTEAQIETKEAADAVEVVVAKGPTLAMNKFNRSE